jgi:signal transduction histidine kinase
LNTGSGATVATSSDVAAARVIGRGDGAAWGRAIVDAWLWRARVLVGLACAAALLLTIASLTLGTSEPATLYAATETLLTLLALGAAWLVRCRVLQTRRGSDLLLAVGVLAFGLVHLIACAIPAALNLRFHGFLVALDVCGEFLAYAVIAAAAFASHEPLLVGIRRPDRLLVAASVSVVGLSAGAAFILSDYLVGDAVLEASAIRHPLAIVFLVAAGGLLVSAAVAFARDAHAGRGPGSWPFACAAALIAAALVSQLNGAVAPDNDSAAEALQIIAFGLIVGAGIRWELQAGRLAARAAAIAERQRVARDLHDGLAQDLAFIAAHGEQFAADAGDEHPVVTAARRALQISRSAIAELSDPDAATMHEALEAIATELRTRFSIAITLDVQLGDELPAEVQEHVARIVREAIANAARHGDAHVVSVSLRDEGGHVRLRVQDDGRGVDAVSAGRPREGFGLRSIRERAAGLGGDMNIKKLSTRGTVLDVVLP